MTTIDAEHDFGRLQELADERAGETVTITYDSSYSDGSVTYEGEIERAHTGTRVYIQIGEAETRSIWFGVVESIGGETLNGYRRVGRDATVTFEEETVEASESNGMPPGEDEFRHGRPVVRTDGGDDVCPECGRPYIKKHSVGPDQPANKRDDEKWVVCYDHEKEGMIITDSCSIAVGEDDPKLVTDGGWVNPAPNVDDDPTRDFARELYGDASVGSYAASNGRVIVSIPGTPDHPPMSVRRAAYENGFGRKREHTCDGEVERGDFGDVSTDFVFEHARGAEEVESGDETKRCVYCGLGGAEVPDGDSEPVCHACADGENWLIPLDDDDDRTVPDGGRYFDAITTRVIIDDEIVTGDTIEHSMMTTKAELDAVPFETDAWIEISLRNGSDIVASKYHDRLMDAETALNGGDSDE